jgi:hypothetical protein
MKVYDSTWRFIGTISWTPLDDRSCQVAIPIMTKSGWGQIRLTARHAPDGELVLIAPELDESILQRMRDSWGNREHRT